MPPPRKGDGDTSPPFGDSIDESGDREHERRRAPTPVQGIDEVPASLGDVGEVGKKVSRHERILVDLVGLDGRTGRLGRVEKEHEDMSKDVDTLKQWRTESRARIGVLMFLGTLAAGLGTAVIERLLR